MRKLTAALVLGILTQCSLTKAQSSPPKKWDWRAVIYAEVGDIEKIEGNKRTKLGKDERGDVFLFAGEYIVHLKPLATLTGNFDAALHPEIGVRVYMGRGGRSSMISRAPAVGAKVIALIGFDMAEYQVSRLDVELLHGRPAMFEVTNFEDPQVKQVIELLRKERAKNEP
jgi:hypothetical protein